MPHSRCAIALMLAVALLVSACSSTRTAYRFADWGIVWWVEDYVTLTDNQKAELEQSVDVYRQWHCSTELPGYADWLSRLEADIKNPPVDEQDVAAWQTELLLALDRLMVEVMPVATALLSTLTDEQINELARNMAANQAEKEREFLDPDPSASLRQRQERILERAERWLGELNGQQKATITGWNKAQGNQTDIWLDGRARWQQALLDVLEQRHSEGFDAALERLILNSAEVRGEQYQAMIARSRPALTSLLSTLLAQSEPHQRSHLMTELAGLRQDFQALSCAG